MLKKFALLGVIVVTLILFAGPVLAEDGSFTNRAKNSEVADEMRPSPRPTPVRALNEVRLRACQARQSAIQNRMQTLTRLVGTIEKSFDSIATRVENYYTNKVVPTGNTVSDYDDLVKAIVDAKTVVEQDKVDVGAKVNAFGCENDDPKGVYSEFRIGMQKVKTDLKSYRTAIKNLIVAVAKVAPKETPGPSETPEATEIP